MFRSMLVAVDGSDIGQKALEQGLAVARAMEIPVHVVHVIQTAAYPALALTDLPPPDIAQQALLMPSTGRPTRSWPARRGPRRPPVSR